MFDARVIAMVLASLGIWLCLVWAVVIKRNLAYLDLLFESAQDLEVSLAPEVQTVSQMRRLGQGFQVSVAGIKRTMPTLARVFGMSTLALTVIIAIAAGYACLFALAYGRS